MSEVRPLSDEQIVKEFLRRVEARQAARQREKRMAASRHAKASTSLSGLTTSAEFEATIQLYDDGRITFEQLLEAARTV